MTANGGRVAFEGRSTAWVKHFVVLPATSATESSYVALLAAAGSPHVAPATAFISHAYGDEFLGVLDAVKALEVREGTKAFYYFDLLVVNQHSHEQEVPFEVLRGEFGESVRAIGCTLLVLRWANPLPLLRAWCVFEIATTLAVGASLKVLMPPADAADFREALANSFDSIVFKTCRVDVEMAHAEVRTDLDNIHLVIIESGGFLKTNQLVVRAMQNWMVDEGMIALDSMPVQERATSTLINNLANLLKSQGKLSAAEPLYREALTSRRCVLGNEHSDTLASINNLASLLSDKGNLSEAELLYLETLCVRRRIFGNEHLSTLGAINNLALVLSVQGKISEAELLYREALAAYRRLFSSEHLDTLMAINNLAEMLRKKRSFDEAFDLHKEALKAFRSLLGDNHPSTLSSINGMANLLRDKGKLGEAETLYRKALVLRRRVLGDDHPDSLKSINNLALILCDQGKLGEAEGLYNEALTSYRRTLGELHPDMLDTIFNFAGLMLQQGKRGKALELYRLELEGVRLVLGDANPSTQQSVQNYQRLVAEGEHSAQGLEQSSEQPRNVSLQSQPLCCALC